MRFIGTTSLIITAIAATMALDMDELKTAPTLKVAYFAKADFRHFRGFVQVLEPSELSQKQYAERFPVEAEASYLFQVVSEPVALANDVAAKIATSLVVDDKGAREQILTGPMMGPFAAFVLFDSHRNPVALVTQNLGVFHTTHIQSVDGIDMYQAVGDWGSFSYCPELRKLVGVPTEPTSNTLTPYLKWKPTK